jgi:type I restriction enzyme R subunit
MYLDKLMYDHRLLQACARTNRPYKGKIAGLIVDLTGVLIKSYKEAIRNYNIFEDEDVKEDLRKYLFKDVDELWESFLFKLEKVRKRFNEISDIELSDFIKQLEVGKISKSEFEEVMSDILLKDSSGGFVSLLKDAVDLFKAVGSYHKKLKYVNEVEWLKILLYSIRRKKRAGKVTIPWREIKKNLLSKLSFDPFEEKKELLIGEFDVEKPGSGKRLIADLLLFAKEKAEEERVPIYREIYKRLLELREKFLKRQIEIEVLLDEVKNSLKLARDYEETRKRLSKVDFVLYNIRQFLNNDALEFKRTEETLRNVEIKKGWDFLPSDWDDVKLSLLMDLKAVSKDIKQREVIADELIDVVIKPIVEQYEETH